MELFIGGFAQNKLEYVKSLYPQLESKEDSKNFRLINDFHLFARERLKSGKCQEEIADEIEKIIDDEEKYSWVMSPEEIERYQKNQHLYKVQDYNFIHDMMKNNDDKKEDEEESEYTNEYYDLVYGEKNFGLSADELLNTIDKKIQMIRLEGN